MRTIPALYVLQICNKKFTKLRHMSCIMVNVTNKYTQCNNDEIM